MQILVVEDEPRMASLLRTAFEEEGYRTTVVLDGALALEMTRVGTFDVIVLDVMIPRLDGFSVARQLRQWGNQTPILMLTAKDGDRDAVRGLDCGADDYLTKPFSLEVLLAHVRAVSRRGPIAQSVQLRAADLILDTASRDVTRAGRPISLTPREYSLLVFLLRNRGRVVSREAILENVWGSDADVDGNTIEVFIRLLRNKLESASAPKLIHTVRGIGYSLRESAH